MRPHFGRRGLCHTAFSYVLDVRRTDACDDSTHQRMKESVPMPATQAPERDALLLLTALALSQTFPQIENPKQRCLATLLDQIAARAIETDNPKLARLFVAGWATSRLRRSAQPDVLLGFLETRAARMPNERVERYIAAEERAHGMYLERYANTGNENLWFGILTTERNVRLGRLALSA